MTSREITFTFLTRARFEAAPQIGLTIVQEWHSFLRWATWPSFGDSKASEGAWCPCALEGGRVKGGRGPMSLLAFDVDDVTEGAIDRSVAALSHYEGAIVPTFSATPAKPKHRVILLPTRPLTPDEFKIAWPKMSQSLADGGITIDRGCKNVNRLYFSCVARSPGTWLGARLLTGDPVPVDEMLQTARIEAEEDRARREERARARQPVAEEHRDVYIRAALDKARSNVASAPEGGRHEALLHEAFALARFDLSEQQIADALLEAFVGAAGESRRIEGRRAIHDAVQARTQGVA
jgi:hypothetical protein